MRKKKSSAVPFLLAKSTICTQGIPKRKWESQEGRNHWCLPFWNPSQGLAPIPNQKNQQIKFKTYYEKRKNNAGAGTASLPLFACDFAPVATIDMIVNDGIIAAIADNAGIFLFLVLLGITDGDTMDDAVYLADKTVKMRVFTDENDKMNRSLADVGGGLLIVSQFTLYGDCRKGNRPSFTSAARPETAIPLYEAFIARCRESGLPVETGEFGADMKVHLLNDGPVTLWMDTKDMRH